MSRPPERPAARLFIAADLAGGVSVGLAPAQAHYLRSVLRLGAGAALALFNGRHGEWLGRIEALGKGWCSVAIVEQRRAQRAEPDLWLAFAPLKRARIDYLVEKATELGAAQLHPVRTERTVVDRINRERLQANVVEAAEQSERLSVPRVHEMVTLAQLVAAWPAPRPLILCDESGRAPPAAAALPALAGAAGAVAILVGPEGGFTETELDALVKLPFVTAIALGPRVLRADTAALAALAVFQAIAGDWRAARVRSAASPPPSRP